MISNLTLTLLTLAAPAQQPDATRDLFRPDTGPISAHLLAEEAVRARAVTLQETDLRGRLRLELFDGLTLEGRSLTRRDAYDGGIVAPLALGGDQSGRAILSFHDDKLVAKLQVEGRIFRVRPLADGRHLIEEFDPSRFLRCEVEAGQFKKSNDRQHGNQAASSGTAFQLDLMTPYISDVTSIYGGRSGVVAMLNLAVFEMNEALARSDANVRINLVHTYESPYGGSASLDTDLDRLENPFDSYMDIAHDLRDEYDADLVQLIVDYGSGLGNVVGSASSSNRDLAFSVANESYVATNLTMAHELGHNLGCHHNIDDDDVPGSRISPTCFGWQGVSGNYRTIMAYPSSSSENRILLFSNPGKLAPDGDVMGSDPSGLNIHGARNFETINTTAYATAQYEAADDGPMEIITRLDGTVSEPITYFDLKPRRDLELTDIALDLTGAGEVVTIAVRACRGSWEDNLAGSNEWETLIQTGVTSNGPGTPTWVSIAVPYLLRAGNTWGFQVEVVGYPQNTSVTQLVPQVGNQRFRNNELVVETDEDATFCGKLRYRGAQGAHALQAPLDGSYGHAAAVFILEAHTDLRIHSLSLNIDGTAGDQGLVDCWIRDQNYGDALDPWDNWMYYGSDTVAIAGNGSPTRVNINPIELDAGDSIGVYLALPSYHTDGHRMMFSTSRTTSNSHITVYSGLAHNGTAFDGSLISSRAFNGTVHFTTRVPKLDVQNVIRNQKADFILENCWGEKRAWLLASLQGDGPTTTRWGTLALDRPIQKLMRVNLDEFGRAESQLSVPPIFAGRQIWLQAVTLPSYRISNGVERTVQ